MTRQDESSLILVSCRNSHKGYPSIPILYLSNALVQIPKHCSEHGIANVHRPSSTIRIQCQSETPQQQNVQNSDDNTRRKALEPCISEQIMRLHHDKHHVAYVNNLNAALRTQSDTSSSARNESEQLELQAVIQFNAGGHINHTLFWENLAPPDSPPTKESAGPKLTAALTKKWGSVAAFQEKFRAVLLGIRGSGWGWLVHSQESGDLAIISSKDQDPVPKGYKPLLGIDMWEHAYYLQYLNDKGGYVSKIWEIVNWEVVEGRFLRSLEEIYGSLQDLRATL